MSPNPLKRSTIWQFEAAKAAREEDLRAFGSCISPAVKVLEVLSKGDPKNLPIANQQVPVFWQGI